MRHDRRNSPPRPIAFCNAGGRRGALPSDLRCNFSVSSTAPLPAPVVLTACGLLRLIVSNFEEPVLFFAVVMAIAFAIYVPPFIACPSLVAFEMCFARPLPATEDAEEAASLRIKISFWLDKVAGRLESPRPDLAK